MAHESDGLYSRGIGGSLSVAEILKGFTMLRGDPRRTDVVSVGLVLRTMQIHQREELEALREMHKDRPRPRPRT